MNEINKRRFANGFRKTVSGSPTTLVASKGKAVISMAIKGNSQLSGTPTPSSPISIVGMGDYDATEQKYKLPIKLNNSVAGTILVSNALLKAGNYADTVNATSGVATKNLGCKVLDGTESWAAYARIANTYYIGILESRASSGVNLLCTHYAPQAQGTDKGVYCGATNIGSVQCGAFYFTDTDYADVETFKAFVAAQYANGTPITIYYPLTTPTTESVTPVNIQTTVGTDTIAVETTIAPSQIEVEYRSGTI